MCCLILSAKAQIRKLNSLKHTAKFAFSLVFAICFVYGEEYCTSASPLGQNSFVFGTARSC